MSALARPQFRPSFHRPLAELDAVRQIGRLAATSINVKTGLDWIAGTALCVKGVQTVQIAPSKPAVFLIGAPEPWQGPDSEGQKATAVGSIKAGDQSWGELRIVFDIEAIEVESPVRFADFLAQQIGCMFSRLELVRRRDALRESINASAWSCPPAKSCNGRRGSSLKSIS